MFNNIKKYKEKDLIKADTGENLIEYWLNVYQEDFYTIERLNDSFSKNLENVLICARSLKSVMQPFIFETVTEKCEIALVHVLVLNKIRNQKFGIEENPHFNELIESAKKSKIFTIIFDKVKKDFDEKSN
jgi:hypothetical protein